MSSTLSSPRSGLEQPRTGLFQILLGVFAWIDVGLATLAGTLLIGAALLVGGLMQIVHSFLDRDWGAFALHLLAGILYVVGGLLIMAEPIQGALVITIALAAVLIVAGAFRVIIAVRHWHLSGAGLLLIGGLFSILIGIGLYLLLPWSGLWVLGTLIAVELIFQGAAWIEFGLGLRRFRNA